MGDILSTAGAKLAQAMARPLPNVAIIRLFADFNGSQREDCYEELGDG